MLFSENEILMLDEIKNIVGNIARSMLCFSFLMLETKNCIVSNKNGTNRSNSNHIGLVCFDSDFICFFILRFR